MKRKYTGENNAWARSDDGRVVIGTFAHVSHRKGAGPWPSTYSISVEDAKALIGEIQEAITSIEVTQ